MPPITKTIQVRRTRHAGHCWRSKDELISDVLLWTPTHGCARVGRPARTYIQQLCEDTECNPEDLPEAMNDREKWRETVGDIRAGGVTWWWWYFANFHPFRSLSISLSLSLFLHLSISLIINLYFSLSFCLSVSNIYIYIYITFFLLFLTAFEVKLELSSPLSMMFSIDSASLCPSSDYYKMISCVSDLLKCLKFPSYLKCAWQSITHLIILCACAANFLVSATLRMKRERWEMKRFRDVQCENGLIIGGGWSVRALSVDRCNADPKR